MHRKMKREACADYGTGILIYAVIRAGFLFWSYQSIVT